MKSIYKNLNPLKRTLFKRLTSSFKNSKNIEELKKIDKNAVKRILVSRPNHRLGNQLLLAPIIQELEASFPNCKIDLVVNGSLSNILYCNFLSLGAIYNLPKKPFKNLRNYISVCFKIITTKYDVAIIGCQSSNSSKIFVKLSRATYKIFDSEKQFQKKEKHIAKIPINHLRHHLYNKDATYPELSIKLSNTEIENGKKTLDGFFKNQKKTICIFTYATGSKKLTKDWWDSITKELESSIPNTNILEILPKENVSQLDFKYTTYLSNDIREMASVIENCEVFIGADSGIMHLATATKTKVLGLFNGATDHEVYCPYGKEKEAVLTKKLSTKLIAEKVQKYCLN